MSSLFGLPSKDVSDQPLNEPRKVTILDSQIRATTILQAASLIWIGSIGWWIGDIVGIGISLAVGGLVIVTPPVIAAAFAHVGLLVILPELATPIAIMQLGLFEIGLVGLLTSEPPLEIKESLISTVFIGSFVILTLWLFQTTGVLEASIILCCAVGGIGYSLHRYERVSIGIVTSNQSKNEINE